MPDTRDALLRSQAEAMGYPLDEPILIGGNYVSVAQHGPLLHVSGQIPRIGAQVKVTGRVGDTVSLAQAQRAARICIMRALCLVQQHLGSLERVARLMHMGVYIQCSADFTQHSEVADAASELLYQVLGEAGRHTRTAVGVHQLPKNASVELNLQLTITGD